MQLTVDDFVESGWEEVIANSRDKECNYYQSHLWRRAHEGQECNDQKTKELFRLLGDICSLHLRLDSPEQPFGPMMSSATGRTAIAEDFDDDQIQFLENIVPKVTDADLRARIADVLWMRKRDYRMAEIAVSSYLESARLLEHPEHWVATDERITRALQVATLIGRNARSYESVLKHIEEVLANYNGDDPLFLSARMMGLLQESRTGDPSKYAALSEKAARRAEAERDWDRARAYWELKSKWHRLANEHQGERNVRLRVAETYVIQAEEYLAGIPPSYMLASTFMQKAIEAYRRVGDSAGRIRDLHVRLLECQDVSVPQKLTIEK